MGAELRPEDEGFAAVGGGVGVAGDAVGGEAGLEDQLRLGAEVVWAPEHDVGELAGLDGADLVGEAVGDGRVDGQLGDVAQHPLVVVLGPVALHRAEFGLHLAGQGEGAAHGLAGPAHALGVGGGDADDAQVVQHVLGAHGAGPDPVAGHRGVTGQVGLEVVGGDDHAEVLAQGVPAERQGGIGGGADDVRHARHLQHIGHVAAAAALDVEGVDRPAVEHPEGVLDGQALVEAVGVQGDLDVVLLGHPQRGVQRAGVRSHVLVHLEAAGAALGEGLHQRGLVGGGAPAEEADVDRPGVEGVEGVPQRPGRVDADAPDRAELLADDRGDAGGERGLHDPRREQVDVGVDGAGGGDQALAGDDGGAGADHDVHAVQGVGVAGPADRGDPAADQADRGLAHALDRVDHQDVADHHVTGVADGGGLEVQAVAGGLAESGQELVARPLGVGLDPDDQTGVAEPDPVPGARAVHRDVVVRGDGRHDSTSASSKPVR